MKNLFLILFTAVLLIGCTSSNHVGHEDPNLPYEPVEPEFDIQIWDRQWVDGESHHAQKMGFIINEDNEIVAIANYDSEWNDDTNWTGAGLLLSTGNGFRVWTHDNGVDELYVKGEHHDIYFDIWDNFLGLSNKDNSHSLHLFKDETAIFVAIDGSDVGYIKGGEFTSHDPAYIPPTIDDLRARVHPDTIRRIQLLKARIFQKRQ